MKTNPTIFDWHVNLDRSLQKDAIIAAIDAEMEVRAYVSEVLRQALEKANRKELTS